MNTMSPFSWYQTAGSLIRSQISKYTPHSKSFSLTYTKGFYIIFGEDFEGLHYIAQCRAETIANKHILERFRYQTSIV